MKVFVYLEDVDDAADTVTYVTEGKVFPGHDLDNSNSAGFGRLTCDRNYVAPTIISTRQYAFLLPWGIYYSLCAIILALGARFPPLPPRIPGRSVRQSG